MRNWTPFSGVYSNMLRMPLFLICSLAAPAQLIGQISAQFFGQVPGQSAPQQEDPLDQAIQTVWQARSNGRFEEAAVSREQARVLLQRKPVDSPQFDGWVQQVSQLYQNSGLNARARAVLQEALARTGPLKDSSHVATLNSLAEAWRQDGNLLKAVEYLELVAAAQTAPPSAATPLAAQGTMARIIMVNVNRTAWFGSAGPVYTGSGIDAYMRLVDLYQQIGRPEAVAAIAAKIRVLGANDDAAMARFYAQHGPLEEAAAIYKKLVEQSPDPQAKANAWQELANLETRQEHYTGAIAATQNAIAAVQSSDSPDVRNQALWMRQNLPAYLRQAGLVDQADQVYGQLLQESRDGPQEIQMVGTYAQYLASSERAAQGETLLKDYLAEHPNLDPQQKVNLLFQLANVVRGTGDSQRAEEYQQEAQALQPPPPPPPAGQIRLGEDMQKAQTAVSHRRWDDAYGLALQLIDNAAHAVDGQQVQWTVPQIAQALAANKEPAKAERLFERLLTLARSWSADSMQPLIAVTQSYAHFLMNQPDRPVEAQAAIEQYRGVLADANGPGSGSLAEALRMKIEHERYHSLPEMAEASARALLELQESLCGNTSEPYLNALQTLAQVYQAAGNNARALPLLRKAIAVVDLVASPNNEWLRSVTRMDAALALAGLGEFDEAETLGAEAVALPPALNTPRPQLAQELEQIRGMKRAAAAARASIAK